MFASSLSAVTADRCEGEWSFLLVRFPLLAVALLQQGDLRHNTQTLLCAAIAARQLRLACINFRYSHSSGHQVANVLL